MADTKVACIGAGRWGKNLLRNFESLGALGWVHVPVANKAEGQVVAVDDEEPLRLECAHFLECVETRQTPRTDGEEAVRVLETLQECERSLRRLDRHIERKPRTKFSDCTVADSAVVAEGVELGTGTLVGDFTRILGAAVVGAKCRIGQSVRIGRDTEIGKDTEIGDHVSIPDGAVLGDRVRIGPSVTFLPADRATGSDNHRGGGGGHLRVGDRARLEANATVIEGCRVSADAVVHPGSVVLEDVPERAILSGNPAEIRGRVCECGMHVMLDGAGTATCPSCGRVYRLTSGAFTPLREPEDEPVPESEAGPLRAG